MKAQQTTRIYLITPPVIDLSVFPDYLKMALDAGDVASLQLRLKKADNDTIKRAADEILPICEEFYIPLILNDRPDLVANVGAHGVHIGQDEGAGKPGCVAKLRKELPDDTVIGVSCYDSKDQAILAGDEGADYVAFSGFYPSKTKQINTGTPVSIINWWTTNTTIPCVAIGGIHAGNAAPLIKSGADFIAVISSVWQHPEGPASGIRALQDVITQLTQLD